MTPEEKIFKVLKKIKNESEINLDTTQMIYQFNDGRVIAPDVVFKDEEIRILEKLVKDGIIGLVMYSNMLLPVDPNSWKKDDSLVVRKLEKFDKYHSSLLRNIQEEKPSKKNLNSGIVKRRSSLVVIISVLSFIFLVLAFFGYDQYFKDKSYFDIKPLHGAGYKISHDDKISFFVSMHNVNTSPNSINQFFSVLWEDKKNYRPIWFGESNPTIYEIDKKEVKLPINFNPNEIKYFEVVYEKEALDSRYTTKDLLYSRLFEFLIEDTKGRIFGFDEGKMNKTLKKWGVWK